MTFSLDGADVVVVGAGTAGMTAALVLADAGAAVTLLERRTEPAAGAGVLLRPSGLAVLDALDLGDPLRTAGRRMPAMTIRSARGTALLPAGVPHAGAGPHGLLATSRGRLHEILLDAIGRRRAIVARFGADVSAADPTGAVDLRWHDLVSTIAADLVVGADGSHSVVRGGGDFAVRIRAAGGPYLCGLLNGNDLDLAGEYWTSLGFFGGAQVDTATTSFYADASAPSVATAVADRDLTALADAWAAALPLAGEVMHRVDRFDRFHINRPVRVDCARWSAGRLVLLGDAAHAMAPTFGQDVTSAVVDAAVLGIELAAGPSLSEALARYTERRRPELRRAQDRADRLTALARVRNPALRLARDTALRVAGRLPAADTRLAGTAHHEDPARLHSALRRLRKPEQR